MNKRKRNFSELEKQILTDIYTSIYLPTEQISLYAASLSTGYKESYIDKIIGILVTDGYVERIRKGYSQETEKITFQGGKGYHSTNVYRTTRKGSECVENELGISDEARNNRKELYSNSLGGNQKDERYIRRLKTSLFGQLIKQKNSWEYTTVKELRLQTEQQSMVGSQIMAIQKIDCVNDTEDICVFYNTGTYITSMKLKCERKILDVINTGKDKKSVYRIVLADNIETLIGNLEVLEARENSKRKEHGSPLLIESISEEDVYFCTNDLTGIKQMKLFQYPNRLRKKVIQLILQKNEEFKEIINEETIKKAEGYSYDAETEDKIIFIGYEEEIKRLLYMRRMQHNTNKQIQIICYSGQKSHYEKLFSYAKDNGQLSIITYDI